NYLTDVEVVTPGGNSAAVTADHYTGEVPVVTAVNTTVNGLTTGPAAGPVVGGETIVLTGQYLNGVTSVSFQPSQSITYAFANSVFVSANGTIATFTAPDATSEYNAYAGLTAPTPP